MSEDDKLRCERLAYESKKGRTLSPTEFGFMEKMWVNHPVEYKAIQKDVHERTTAELNPLFRRP